MTTFVLIKQCCTCGNQYDNREVDELEAIDKEPTAIMVNYDQYNDTKELLVTGTCDDCLTDNLEEY